MTSGAGDLFSAISGGMARRTEGFDWSTTSLGPIGQWPTALRTVTALMLSSHFPQAVLWGADHIALFNDAFLPILGPAAMPGQPFATLLPQAWDHLGPICDAALGGQAGHIDNCPLTLSGKAEPEQAYFTVSTSPIRDECGTGLGLLVTFVDTSESVRAAQHQEQMHFLDTLSAEMEKAPDSHALFALVTRMVGEHLGLSGCIYTDVDPDQDRFSVRGDWAAPGLAGMPGQYRLSQFGRDAFEMLNAGRAFIIKDVKAELPSDEVAPYDQIGIASCVGIPLMKGGRLAAVMGIYDRRPRQWSNYSISLVRKVIGRCWAQVERRRADDQLRRAQEAGGIGLFAIDIENNAVHGTPAFFRIFGLPERDIIASAEIEELVIAEDAHLISDRHRRESGEAPLYTEYRIRRPDTGEIRTIARKGEFEKDVSGRPVRLLGAVRDVTEQQAIQRALEESEERFRTLADSMPICIWTASRSGKVTWYNAWTFDYTGASADSIMGSGWLTLIHEGDRDALIARWTKALETGQPYEVEFRLRRSDGEYRWQLSRIMPMLEQGDIVRWLGTTTDIHEQKQAEARSIRDRERIWTMSQDLLLVIDRGAVIADLNPTAIRLLGWDANRMAGRSLLDFVVEADRDRAEAIVQRLLLGEAVVREELAFHARGAVERQIAWNFVSEGDVLFGFGRDITEQRLIEEALRQSQKMEAVGQLTGGIAHDFNNLLQGISGNLELLQTRLEQGRTDGLDRFLQGASASASRASALTHRLLAFSRRQPLDPRPVQANPLIASMEDMLLRTLGEHIDLELVLTDDLWLTRCDPNQLESAILNLTINARDAMPAGGRLLIETANSYLTVRDAMRMSDVEPGDYVCIRVNDSGVGMDAATLARAFEPFFTTKPIGQGTGLGLSMIYGFTRQSEGYTRIDSEAGHGTSVALYLPRYYGEAPSDETAAPPMPDPAKAADETILVVEDQPVVRSLIVEILSGLGYHVLEAADGFGGMKVLQSDQRVDLLVTDIGLPGLDGRQVAEAGRHCRPGLRILFMTGYAEMAAMSGGFLEPGMGMITKPFTVDALVRRINEMIGTG